MSDLSRDLEEAAALFPEDFGEKRTEFLKGFKQALKGVIDGKVNESYLFNTTHANQALLEAKDGDKFEYFGFGMGYIIAILKYKPRELLKDSHNNSKLILCIQNVDITSTYAQQEGYPHYKTLGPELGRALHAYNRLHARQWYEKLKSMVRDFSPQERKSFDEIGARLKGIL